jgi:hypothetical protein
MSRTNAHRYAACELLPASNRGVTPSFDDSSSSICNRSAASVLAPLAHRLTTSRDEVV